MVHEASCRLYQEMGQPREDLPGTILQKWHQSIYLFTPPLGVLSHLLKEKKEYEAVMAANNEEKKVLRDYAV